MSNNLVGYSRAGDVFHYRWAARRCLALVDPKTLLRNIVIEGSKEKEKAGEYVIDMSEYYIEAEGKEHIIYFQLKHTTVKKKIPFQLSDLKDTFTGFAKRFLQHTQKNDDINFSFSIITNRLVKDSLKQNIVRLANGENADKRIINTLIRYTALNNADLSRFCSLISFKDGEGDYIFQKDELRLEVAHLISGVVDNAQVESIVAMVQERVLPDSDGTICREDILKRFKIYSEKDLFPAPAFWEKTDHIIGRVQYKMLIESISNSSNSSIVHAPGGVGKSMFSRQLIKSIPENSFAITYDCFGAGSYRNRSEPRHTHQTALIQIVNELAVRGLCDILLKQTHSQDSDIMRKFLWRIEEAVKNLKFVNPSSQLFILIDAADNAEMAAKEFNNACFANELLRESIPEGCKLVLLCRTERIPLLKPSSKINRFELQSFSKNESLQNMRGWFPEANEKDGLEFHRLTSGNPRVQANALSIGAETVLELLNLLGPSVITVENQIKLQLNNALSNIKDNLSETFKEHIDAICIGLASLPPHIPLKILAQAASVSVDDIRSFVSDLGRSLWLSDESVQFRDEPTETWFRTEFLAKREDFETYIDLLEPLAKQNSYVAEVLPNLYLQAEKYDKLIELSLSDDLLPLDNPIDARNVRVYRLQFAFRAALRAKQYKDAIKIAIRAGEEMAGNQRQISFFKHNVDLLVALQDKQKIQEIALKRILSGHWNGSENVYAASLLSGIEDYKGEARGYLRASLNWLKIYFDEADDEDDSYFRNELTDADMLELAYAYLNIYGADKCIEFFDRFKKIYIFNIIQNLTSRLIDSGDFELIHELLSNCDRKPYYTVAITGELVKIGQIPEKKHIETCLTLLLSSKDRIEKPLQFYNNTKISEAIVSFIESCLYHGLSDKKLLRVLKYYIPERAWRMVYYAHQSIERTIFLRTLAIRSILADKFEVDINFILPQELIRETKKNKFNRGQEIKELTEFVNTLFPWFILRCKILSRQTFDFLDALKNAHTLSSKAKINRYQTTDPLLFELASIQSSILIISKELDNELLQSFYETYIKKNNSLPIDDEINNVRSAFRSSHLLFLKQELEQNAYSRIKNIIDDGPEESASRYLTLARSVLNSAREDASAYFEEALDIMSKFGDEIVSRWDSIISLSERATIENNVTDELAYRFIRCAEVVGEYAREKNWDRSRALAVCTRMSSGVGISALSRWRDRQIGRFKYQFQALLLELLQSNKIASKAAWAMVRLLPHHQLENVLLLCLKKETNKTLKSKIFDDAIHLLQLEGCDSEYWLKMKELAIEEDLYNDVLDKILFYYSNRKNLPTVPSRDKSTLPPKDDMVDPDWNILFIDVDIFNAEQFEKCFKSYKNANHYQIYRRFNGFWDEVTSRVDQKDIWRFIDMLLTSGLSRYELKQFISSVPETWRNKISFKKKWPLFVNRLGKKYAKEIIKEYSFKSFVTDFNLTFSEIENLKAGIFEGLAEGHEFADADMFFGFVSAATSMIQPNDAVELIEFSLCRFELHIESDFGDGDWHSSLATNNDLNNQLAGFLWAALGSPKSLERWNAVHAVRMLGIFDCQNILDELINWMELGKAESFTYYKFPFYKFHAKLFLLIALAKISDENPKLLIRHKDKFVLQATEGKHILIQKFAKDIATNILNSKDENSNSELLNQLNVVGKSLLPETHLENGAMLDSYWHLNERINTEHDFYFGLDIGEFWFKYLGKAFGISFKQIEDLAADIIINEWEMGEFNGFSNDPRNELWNRLSNDRDTSFRKADYPRTDDISFYLSYHSMMVLASKLLDKMPLIAGGEKWTYWDAWLERHQLTSDDGEWLADLRDPVPLKRPDWTNSENYNENWRSDISDDYFYDTLVDDEKSGEIWINVHGLWEERNNERYETYTIASSLVSRNSSDALLRALQTCKNPHDYKIPDYKETNCEIETNLFKLKGWIDSESVSKKLDQYDPYADNIDYPYYKLGEDILNKLNLNYSSDRRVWYLKDLFSPAVRSETWSSYRIDLTESPDQSGTRLKASLKFLTHMCSRLDCDLIFEVDIKRDISYKYRSSDEKYEYSEPSHKLFILSADGKLRTTEKNYRIR